MEAVEESAKYAVPSKSQAHGRIGEAAVYAKCWMHGIPAYHTGGLRSNFAGSDLIVETADARAKLWIQVKTGAPGHSDKVYFTQCAGDEDLQKDKFSADFVVFVNLDAKAAKAHEHDGTLDFSHLSFYVVPRDVANRLYRASVEALWKRPKRDGGQRKLANMGVHADPKAMRKYKDAWHLIRAKRLSIKASKHRTTKATPEAIAP